MGDILKRFFVLLILLLIFSRTAFSLRIDEIMYNPAGTDSGHEWVEIYNDGPEINITGWKFYESGTNHGLTLVNGSYLLLQNKYAIIADDKETFLMEYPDFNSTLFDSSFSLSNTGETIAIKDDDLSIIDEVAYDNGFGNGNGKSLGLINNSWQETTPTPGQQNSLPEQAITQDLGLEVYLDDEIYANLQYTKLFKIINVNPEFGKVYNITVSYNITKDSQIIKQDFFTKDEVNQYSTTSTGFFTATEAGNYLLCGILISSTAEDANPSNDKSCKAITVIDTSSFPCNVSVNITTEKNFYLDNETVRFYNNLSDESFPYIIEYWIEDLFGNIFKKKINTTNTNQKSYSPRISEQDLVLLVRNQLYVLCNDSNTFDNSAENMIIVKNTNPLFLSTEENSSLEITAIYDLGSDNKAKFGQTIRARLDIYKGDTTKSSITLWVEDDKGDKLSKESKTNVYRKYVDYVLALPVQIKPNCGYGYDDGIYKLIAEGLDKRDSRNIEIEGITRDLCEKTTIEKVKESSGSFTYAITDSPYEVYPEEEFTIQLSLKNDDNERHKATIWSYVYRGNKCYCRDREENKKEISIAPEKEEIVTLKNRAIGAEPGDYNLKVKIIKDSQKTARELTREIRVTSSVESFTQSFFQNQLNQEISLESEKQPTTVYESANIKTQKLIPVFIIIVLTILAVILIWKR